MFDLEEALKIICLVIFLVLGILLILCDYSSFLGITIICTVSICLLKKIYKHLSYNHDDLLEKAEEIGIKIFPVALIIGAILFVFGLFSGNDSSSSDNNYHGYENYGEDDARHYDWDGDGNLNKTEREAYERTMSGYGEWLKDHPE